MVMSLGARAGKYSETFVANHGTACWNVAPVETPRHNGDGNSHYLAGNCESLPDINAKFSWRGFKDGGNAATEFIRAVLAVSLTVAVEGFGNALITGLTPKFVVSTTRTRNAWSVAGLFVGVIAAIVLRVTHVRFVNAPAVVATELVRFAIK